MTKRLKQDNDLIENTDCQMSVDEKILSSDVHGFPTTTITSTPTYTYHTSPCGSLLYTSPTKISSDIFSFLRHNNFDSFRRSFEIYYNDIILMVNDHGQTILHVLVIHAYPYVWVRLTMMRGCDPCVQDIDGYTAAHYAVERDDVEMLKALTHKFHAQARPIPEEKVNEIHAQCLKALSIRDNCGRTVFMLACYRDSLKCLDYLIELGINDSNLEDKFGDTCLQYAVARHNLAIVGKLIGSCQANVNGGNQTRPSALDIAQFNREQPKQENRDKADQIEQFLKQHNARNRCSIRRISNKRKSVMDNNDVIVTNLACITLDNTTNGQIETGKSFARMALSLYSKGDLSGAQESYKKAMNCVSEDTIEWAGYAFHVAVINIIHGKSQLALDLLKKALRIREQLEGSSQEIDQIRQTIENLQNNIV